MSRGKCFFVQGDVLGETTVTATAKFGDRSTSSQPMPIQVFPPLQLEPRNITLIIGAKFQVRVVGGPQPSSALEFALANGEYKVTEDTAPLGMYCSCSTVHPSHTSQYIPDI